MTYRILSLDGGGPWALIEAAVLDDLAPDVPGHHLLGRFDLVVANSGGSIVLAGLIKNLTARQILNMFLDQSWRDRIFVRRDIISYEVDKLLGVGPKWRTDAKLTGLRDVLNADPAPAVGDLPMSAIPALVRQTSSRDVRIVICAYDYDLNREVFFCAPSSPLANLAGFEPDLAGAVHASTNAPVNYFDEPAVVADHASNITRRFWDGGVGGFNNPVLHGVVEALRQGVPATDIVALSLGTSTVWRPVGRPTMGENSALFHSPDDSSILTGIKKMAAAVLDDPPDASTLNAHVITAAKDDAPRIVRMSPVIRPEFTGEGWRLPSGFAHFHDPKTPANPLHELDAFTALVAMPMDAVAQEQVDLIHQLARQWQAGNIPNQSILHDPATAACRAGHDTYAKARAAALNWFC